MEKIVHVCLKNVKISHDLKKKLKCIAIKNTHAETASFDAPYNKIHIKTDNSL